MSILLVLLRKDFANFFANKAAVSLTFLVPFAMIYVFGQVFGVNQSDRGPSGIPLGVVNASSNPAGVQLVNALQSEKTFKVVSTFPSPSDSAAPPRALTEADLAPLMRDNAFRFAVVVPEDFLSDTAFGLHLKIYSNPRNDIETQMVNGILQRTLFASVPQLLGQSLQAAGRRDTSPAAMDQFNRTLANNIAQTFGGNPDELRKKIEEGNLGLGSSPAADVSGSNGKAGRDLLSKLVRIDTEQVAGRDVKSPAATRLVSGFAIQFLLFALSSSAAALFYERDRGIFHRILAGPVSRTQILWSKLIYGASLGLLQLSVLFIGGRILYGIDIEHHLGYLSLVSLVVAATCTAAGMLIASIASSAEAAGGLATFVILLMCSVGGAWFPVSLMPDAIQQLSRLTIVFWAMEAFDQVLWLNASLTELLPTLGILLTISAIFLGVAAWRFNRSNLFQ